MWCQRWWGWSAGCWRSWSSPAEKENFEGYFLQRKTFGLTPERRELRRRECFPRVQQIQRWASKLPDTTKFLRIIFCKHNELSHSHFLILVELHLSKFLFSNICCSCGWYLLAIPSQPQKKNRIYNCESFILSDLSTFFVWEFCAFGRVILPWIIWCPNGNGFKEHSTLL